MACGHAQMDGSAVFHARSIYLTLRAVIGFDRGSPLNKAIITVVGQDTVGIIARVCTYLSDHKVNVVDISQTIIDGFFNMMMIVDYSGADNEFGVIVEDLDKLGEQIGVRIRCQREEIFTKMHRV